MTRNSVAAFVLRMLVVGGFASGALAQADPFATPTPRPSKGAYQYGIEMLKLDRAWEITRGRAHLSLADGDGPMNHEDLASGLAGNFRAHISDTVAPGGQFYHAMLVAGVMAARGSNGKGIAGACAHCSFSRHVISGSTFAAGLRAALASGASAVNLSLGYGAGPGETPLSCTGPLQPAAVGPCDAVRSLEDRDIVLVSIAQNYALAKIPFPGNTPTVLAVGGVQPDGKFWTEGYDALLGSNWGPELRLVTPARDVLSTHPPDAYLYDFPPYRCGERVDSTLGSGRSLPGAYAGYGDCTGTSFAAPWVTGIVGLIRSIDPLLSAAAVRAIVNETATTPVPGPPGSGLTFYLPDAEAAVKRALGPGAANRVTPLFSLHSAGAARHLFTSSPATAVAAVAGELPIGYLTVRPSYRSFGEVVSGYPHFAGRICDRSAGETCSSPIEARMAFGIYSMETPPIAGTSLVPLYRLSQVCNPGPGCATSRALAYATSEAAVHELESRGYVIDVVEGYLFSPAAPAPSGTTPVCLAFDAGRIDHILYARSQCDRTALQDSTGATTGGNYATVGIIGHAPAPLPPNRTGLWWNPSEAGWGINFAHQGNIVFATLFTYDASGKPVWLVMPDGRATAAQTFAGTLYRTSGKPPSGTPYEPIAVTPVGSMRVSFSGADAATLQYELNGAQVSKTVSRQVFGASAADCRWTESSRAAATNFQDLWWNPAESGWGLNVTHQGSTVFATLFTYGADGAADWYVMSSGRRQGDGSYSGDLYHVAGGSPFNAQPFVPISAANVLKVGTMHLAFSDGENGTLTYSVDATSVSRPITRQVFAAPAAACASAEPNSAGP